MLWSSGYQWSRQNNNLPVVAIIVLNTNVFYLKMTRMLTGDEIMTTGETFIDNISLKKDKSRYLQSIGYCPQFDSIIEVG